MTFLRKIHLPLRRVFKIFSHSINIYWLLYRIVLKSEGKCKKLKEMPGTILRVLWLSSYQLVQHLQLVLIFYRPCISISLFISINQLDALNFYNKFISSLYMFRAHVLIVRRPKLYYTTSGIITPISGRPVHRVREPLSTCAPDGHL